MTMLLAANNLTSAIIILTCWWLAHINARAQPPGRAIAAGYAMVGVTVLFTGISRNIDVMAPHVVPWLIVITKAVLAMTFLLTIYRRARLGDR
ncbi:hypothetical protein [Tranquillimonas rosea]|uniref:hypothetical protein n=1 Tax=Tranquillimonas rosea TaxID=641238 RepID=UPI003BA84A8F